MMDESTSIPFDRTLDATIALQRIAGWRPTSRFVVVQYAKDGNVEEYGKRLDLDKRAFLDGFDDQALDAKLERLIPDIVQAVAERRRHAGRDTDNAAKDWDSLLG